MNPRIKDVKPNPDYTLTLTFTSTIQWKNGQDLCPDTLYLESK